MLPRAWLIANPRAGQKAGLPTNTATPADARRALERHGFAVELHVTERPGHATDLAREAVAVGAGLVVVGGGDGTIHEAARGLIGTDVVLGLIPLGSAVNMGTALEVPRDLDAAAEVLRAGRTLAMDVGLATTTHGQTHFFEIGGVGLDAPVFVYSRGLDKGHWRYFWPLVRSVAAYRPRRARLVLDDHRFEASGVLMVSAAIAPVSGLGLKIAPDARVDDHRFDVVIRRADSWRDLVRHAASLVLGPPLYRAKTGVIRASCVEVNASRPMPVHADGRALGRTPAEFRVLPGALKVIAGGEPPAA